MSALTLPLPRAALAPALPTALPAVSPTLARTLLLAVLLHLWLVLLLGNTPGGTAQPGHGVAGRLNITLRGPETPGVAEAAAPPLPTGPVGEAALPRWGGRVREQAQPLPGMPGAAQLGEWAARPAPVATPAAPPVPPGQVVEESAAALPRLPAPQAPLQPPNPTAPETMAERSLASPLTRADAPAADVAALEAAVPAAPLRALSLPSRAPELAAAVAPPLPVLATLPAAAQPPQAPMPSLPAITAAITPAQLPVAPALLPQVAALPEPALRRLSAPAPATPPAAAQAPQAPLPASTAVPLSLPPALPAMPSLGAAPDAAAPAATPTPGMPDAGNRIGQDVATPAAAAASTPPRLNLQLTRPRGGELSRFSAPGVLPLLPRPPETDEKLARAIEKSAKRDCRNAYSGTGLLAVVPLAAQALRKDADCKW